MNILAIDVHYANKTDVDMDVSGMTVSASIAGVLFDAWTAATPKAIYHSHIDKVADYCSGEFYKRELPCILSLINTHALTPDYILIDGYVHFGTPEHAGLGMYVYHALDKRIPVIGVAKNAFKHLSQDSNVQLLRGTSKKPLYITAIGINQTEAVKNIATMHGQHRIPTLLKLADTACRHPKTNPNPLI